MMFAIHTKRRPMVHFLLVRTRQQNSRLGTCCGFGVTNMTNECGVNVLKGEAESQ